MMKKNSIIWFVAVLTLFVSSCKDDEAEIFLDGQWHVIEMNTVNDKGDVLNIVKFKLGECVITIDKNIYKEEVNMMKGGIEVRVVSIGVCTRTGSTFDVEIRESNKPMLENQRFSLEFTNVLDEANSTSADIYSRSGDIIRTGKLVRL